MFRTIFKWVFRVVLGLVAVAVILVLLHLNRAYRFPDRLAEANVKTIAEQCKMDDGDKLIIDSIFIDSDYYSETPDGSWRLVARRTHLGEMFCIPTIGCLTEPEYKPDCFDGVDRRAGYTITGDGYLAAMHQGTNGLPGSAVGIVPDQCQHKYNLRWCRDCAGAI